MKKMLLSVLLSICLISCGREPASTPQSTSSSASASAPAAAAPPAVPDGLEPLPDSAFRVEWSSAKLPPTLQAGQIATVIVAVKNRGDEQWPSKGSLDASWAGLGAARLSYRCLD